VRYGSVLIYYLPYFLIFAYLLFVICQLVVKETISSNLYWYDSVVLKVWTAISDLFITLLVDVY
jgi:hypothetical protein